MHILVMHMHVSELRQVMRQHDPVLGESQFPNSDS